MEQRPIVFDSSVAQNYDDLLGDFMFEPFALDLLEKTNVAAMQNVLELACGTGRVTKHLSHYLPGRSKLTATDINSGMVAVAKKRVENSAIRWETADISKLPYQDNAFDLIVCQFGLMFVPDKLTALKEIYRVLQPGGKLIFSTWAPIAINRAWLINNRVVNSFLGNKPTLIFEQGPFCMDQHQPVIDFLEEAGFNQNRVTLIEKVSEIESASVAAQGFILGLPTLNLINERIPDLLFSVVEKLESELAAELGNHPLKTVFRALLFEASK